MNLTGLHILLTYWCNDKCDHCFTWGSPMQKGTFTWGDLQEVLDQAKDVKTIKTIFFEGGEPFLHHKLLVKGVALANELGFSTGIVTNGFWANKEDRAIECLKPLRDAGLDLLQVSSDYFHRWSPAFPDSHPALFAAEKLGIDVSTITVDPPNGYRVQTELDRGEPLSGGGVMYRGRAAKLIAPTQPTQKWMSFRSCPYEDLNSPKRVHLDPFGNLHLCQGLLMGNLFEIPLKEIVESFDAEKHPLVGPLVSGGPTELIYKYLSRHAAGYVDACHACYSAREMLRARFPEFLGPDQMYGDPEDFSNENEKIVREAVF